MYLVLLLALGSFAYLKRDPLLQFFGASPRTAVINEPVPVVEPQETSISWSTEQEEPEIPVTQPVETRTQPPVEAETGQNTQPEPAIDFSGVYASDLTVTRNEFSVDEDWYFGEVKELRVKFERNGDGFIGFVEGSREGRIEGTIRGNEISFRFYLVDPGGNLNQGNGIWFVARDGNKMIGQWSLVNASDGSTFLEGDWKLTKFE